MRILDACLLRNYSENDIIGDFHKICIISEINLNLNLKPKVFRKINLNLNLNLKFCREPDLNLNLILKRRTYQQ